MHKPISLISALAICGAIALPAQAAPCDEADFKSNNNKKGSFSILVRSQSQEPDWVYFKKGKERKMPRTYAKGRDITFDNKARQTYSIELRRTGLPTSEAIFCEYDFLVSDHAKEFQMPTGGCALANGEEPGFAEIECTRSYNYKKHQLTIKLSVMDK